MREVREPERVVPDIPARDQKLQLHQIVQRFEAEEFYYIGQAACSAVRGANLFKIYGRLELVSRVRESWAIRYN